MRFHGTVRELKRSPEGKRSFGLGARIGYWPCLKAPFAQIVVLFWRLEAWYGMPSYKGENIQ